MKKILSITLVVAMVMSLFCIVPASAAVKTASPKYFFEDFETGTADKNSLYYGKTATNTLPTFVAGGADGSAYAAEIYYKDQGNYILNFTGSDSDAANLTHWTIAPGETLTFSFKFKWTELNGQTAHKDLGLKLLTSTGSLQANNGFSTTSATWKYNLKSQTDTWQTPTWVWTNTTEEAVTLNGKSYNGNIMANFYATKGVKYLIDDIELKITDSVTTNDPVVTGLTATQFGSTIKYSYAAIANDESIIKAKSGDAVIGSCKAGEVLTVSQPNAQNISVEVLPISNGVIGTAVSLANVPKATAVAFTAWNAANQKEIDDYIADDTVKVGLGYVKSASHINGTEWIQICRHQQYHPDYDVALEKGATYKFYANVDPQANNAKIKITTDNGQSVTSEALVSDDGYGIVEIGELQLESAVSVLTFTATADSTTATVGYAGYRLKEFYYVKTADAVEEPEEPENDATVIAFDGDTNNVVVTSAYVGSAKVIWVAYDANDKMTSHAISAAITLVNTGSTTVPVPGTFTAGTKVKAMLWVDEVNCKPLTGFITRP